jgi:hypothetical protein
MTLASNLNSSSIALLPNSSHSKLLTLSPLGRIKFYSDKLLAKRYS